MKHLLPVERAHRLQRCPEERRWLIEDLWADEAVGIIGGEPKCCKSFLALDMAVAVAAGVPCLGRFRTMRKGRVLLYGAEDALHVIRERLEGICARGGVSLEAIDIQVITAPTLRLDLEDDRNRLFETVAALRPILLVLDPFVRLHRIDENASQEVAPILAYLREVQRRFSLSVVLVHHAKKGAAKIRDGQALRGSSEFHAWGDSNLYLRRTQDGLLLAIEHRAAPSLAGIPLVLRKEEDGLALEVIELHSPLVARASAANEPTDTERVEAVLKEASEPLSVAGIRALCRIRTQRVTTALAALLENGRIVKTSSGYQLAS
jgi:hypothetical protein